MQIMKFLAILVPLFALALAQSQFVRAVGGTNNDGGNSVVQTSDGGLAVAGLTYSYGAGSYDFFLVKFSSTGTYEWSRAVGGTSDDDGWSVVQTSDGGFAVAGMTRSYGAGEEDFFFIKFTSTGSVEWYRIVGGTIGDWVNSIVQTTDGSFVGTGIYNYDYMAWSGHLFVVKFTSTGTLEWSRAFSGADVYFIHDEGMSIIQTSDAGFAVAGYTSRYGAGTEDLLLVKFRPAGSIEWARAVGGTNYDRGYSIIQTSDGGFAVAGLTWSYGAGNDDLFLVKFTSIGSVEWARTIGGINTDWANSIIQTSDGGLVATGLYDYEFTTYTAALILIKFTSTGSLEWSHIIGEAHHDEGMSIIRTSDGGLAVAGYTLSYGAGGDLFLVKFDAEGNTCIGEAVSPTIMEVTPTVTDVTPTIVDVTPTITDVAPIVADIAPTITEICTDDIMETVIKPATLEISVSPNPFNSSCEISIACGRGLINQTPTTEIFDVEGKKITELSNGQRIWTPEKEIGSGIYFVKATIKDGQSAIKRIVFMK